MIIGGTTSKQTCSTAVTVLLFLPDVIFPTCLDPFFASIFHGWCPLSSQFHILACCEAMLFYKSVEMIMLLLLFLNKWDEISLWLVNTHSSTKTCSFRLSNGYFCMPLQKATQSILSCHFVTGIKWMYQTLQSQRQVFLHQWGSFCNSFPASWCRGEARVSRLGGLEPWACRMEVWGQSPQWGPGAEPLVRGSGGKDPPPWSWKHFNFLRPPEVTFQGIKMFFYCNFSTKNFATMGPSTYYITKNAIFFNTPFPM